MVNDSFPRAVIVRGTVVLVALLSVLLTPASPVHAQSVPSWSLAEVLDRLDLIQRMSSYGEKASDPLALIAAAQMTTALDARASDARVVRGAPTQTEGLSFPSADALLQLADRMSVHRVDLSGAIQVMRNDTVKGATRGPRIGELALGPRSELELEVDGMLKDLPALFELASPQLDQLVLQVIDSTDSMLCAPPQGQRPKQCRWTPTVTGKAIARIRNLADQTVAFRWGHN